MNRVKPFILVLLALLLISYILWLAHDSQILQSVVLILAGVSVIGGLIALQRRWKDADQILLRIVVGGGVLIIAGICWNALFLAYIKNSGYQQDIFRGIFQNFHAPVYGLMGWSKWPWNLLLVLLSVAFIVRVLRWQEDWIESRYLVLELLAWFTGLILVFTLSDGPDRLLGTVSHYQTFAADISSFEGVRHVLQTYTQQMPQLSIQNGHYPPGNLILMMIESQLGVTWFARAIVIGFTLLTFLPMIGIASELQLSTYSRHIALALFISAPAVLSLPSVTLTPIPMFLTAAALWLTLAAIRRESIVYAAAVGVVMLVFSYFSFTSLIVWGLLVMVGAVQVLMKKARTGVLLKQGFLAILFFLVLCWLFYTLTGFDLLESFLSGIEHNQSIMSTSFDSFWRYLFRATGNLIAWFLSLGFAAAVLGILAGSDVIGKARSNPRPATAFTAALLAIVILAAFSTHFYLETERVWLFLVPPWMLAAAEFAGQVSERHKGVLFKTLLIFSILMALGHELVFQPFTW